jgi:hypothetical protein
MYAPDTQYFEIYDTIEKPAWDDSCALLARNFEMVEAGEAYARSDEEALVADEGFVPVLLSQSGYSDSFGSRGRRVGTTVAEAEAAWLDGAE